MYFKVPNKSTCPSVKHHAMIRKLALRNSFRILQQCNERNLLKRNKKLALHAHLIDLKFISVTPGAVILDAERVTIVSNICLPYICELRTPII